MRSAGEFDRKRSGSRSTGPWTMVRDVLLGRLHGDPAVRALVQRWNGRVSRAN